VFTSGCLDILHRGPLAGRSTTGIPKRTREEE
jgi:hypothetical protein